MPAVRRTARIANEATGGRSSEGDPMDPYKTTKLNHALRKTLSQLLESAVKDPRIGFVTVGGVELNRDHSVARVYISVLGDEREREQSLAGLIKARGFLQGRLARALRLRQTPELRFVYDDSYERSEGVETVLRELAERGELATAADRRRDLALADLQPPDALLQALCAAQRIWVVPHWNPDPDAMGAALAVSEALACAGKESVVWGYADPPLALVDLPGFAEVVPAAEAEAVFAARPPDLVLLVDCHRTERCGDLAETLDRADEIWCIDHHLVSGRRAPLPGWVDERVCSACSLVHQVVAELARGAGGRCEPFAPTLTMATNIYTGLVNDTGGFRFSNTLPMTFALAGELASRGVDTAEVARQTLHRHRPAGMALLEKVLGSFAYYADGRILTARVTQAMLAATSARLSDAEGFINLATAVEGVVYVAFLKELAPDEWRVSLRVRGEGDVQSIAARYGGGGHRQAAGCTIAGEGEAVMLRLVAELSAALTDA
jgi:phosphoesterase RecJ-like protein